MVNIFKKQLFFSLLLVLISAESHFGQPGKTTFPYISFFDGYVNFKIPPYDWGTPFNGDSLKQRAIELSTLMDSLGITHSVSWADKANTDGRSGINRNRKILDMHLEWSSFAPEVLGVETGKYLRAQGLDRNYYPFQIGGKSLHDLTFASNFGFGTELNSSVWFMNSNPELIPSWVGENVIGTDTTIFLNSGSFLVRKADPANRSGSTKKYMVYGKVNRVHFTNTGEQHYFSLKAMIGQNNLHDTTTVLKIQMMGVSSSGSNPSERLIELPVRKKDLSSTDMEWVTFTDTSFHFKEFGSVSVDKVIEVGILYEDIVSVYIDAVSIHDKLYQEFFNDSALRNKIKSQLNAKKKETGNQPLFETFYCDEPFMLTANVRKTYTEFVRGSMPSGKSFDLAGASGNFWRWHSHFDRVYASNTITGFYKNTFIFDHYPFKYGLKHGYEPGGQAEIQSALNDLIEYRGERVLPNNGQDDPYQYMGLLAAANGAQNFTLDLNDDIPLIHTIQVCGARNFNHAKRAFIPGGNDLRLQTRQEIEVQGNIALSFGAKGFMFYMIPTRVDYFPGSVAGMVTYGVFDDQNAVYNELSQNVAEARADKPQIPNSRYWALRNYIKSLRPIENWILRTSWVGTFCGNIQKNRISSLENWIYRVTTRLDTLAKGFDDISYTESGMLRLTKFNDPVSIEPDTLFLYVTNKLVDVSKDDSSASSRFVRVYLGNFGLTNKNLSLFDMSVAGNPVISSLKAGIPDSRRYFDVKISGGGGKLIMVAPSE